MKTGKKDKKKGEKICERANFPIFPSTELIGII